MSVCKKCGSEDHGELLYGICPVCRKRMEGSIPLIDFTKKDFSIKQIYDITRPRPPRAPQKLSLKIKNNMKKNKIGSTLLILDLIALILIIIFLNTFIYAGIFSLLAVIFSFLALLVEIDDNQNLIGYALIIGIILNIIIFLPLILIIIQFFLILF